MFFLLRYNHIQASESTQKRLESNWMIDQEFDRFLEFFVIWIIVDFSGEIDVSETN